MLQKTDVKVSTAIFAVMGVKDEITYNEDFYNWAVKTVPVYGFGSETVN